MASNAASSVQFHVNGAEIARGGRAKLTVRGARTLELSPPRSAPRRQVGARAFGPKRSAAWSTIALTSASTETSARMKLAASAELPCKFLSSVLATAGNHNFGSVRDENLGGAGRDPARPAGNNRHLSFEWQHGNRLLVLGSRKSLVPLFQLPHFTLAPALRTTTHLPARFLRRSI
jgi:hypothetical protein